MVTEATHLLSITPQCGAAGCSSEIGPCRAGELRLGGRGCNMAPVQSELQKERPSGRLLVTICTGPCCFACKRTHHVVCDSSGLYVFIPKDVLHFAKRRQQLNGNTLVLTRTMAEQSERVGNQPLSRAVNDFLKLETGPTLKS